MPTTKPFVFDKPKIITQTFTVSLNDGLGRIFVTRKEVHRKIHNMGCTDGLPDDHVDIIVDYEFTREVDMVSRQKAMDAVEEELEKSKQAHIRREITQPRPRACPQCSFSEIKDNGQCQYRCRGCDLEFIYELRYDKETDSTWFKGNPDKEEK